MLDCNLSFGVKIYQCKGKCQCLKEYSDSEARWGYKKKDNADKKGTWKERKLHTIQHLCLLDKPSKIISCCDKLHNAQSMNIDYMFVGDELWCRFNATKSAIFWYYQSCLDAYKTRVSIEESKVFALYRREIEILCSH